MLLMDLAGNFCSASARGLYKSAIRIFCLAFFCFAGYENSVGRSDVLHRGHIAEVSKPANGGGVSMVLCCFADRFLLRVWQLRRFLQVVRAFL